MSGANPGSGSIDSHMIYYQKHHKQKHKLSNDFKAQFDDSTKAERVKRNKAARKLAKKNTRWSKRMPNLSFNPLKVYKLSDKPLNYHTYLKSPYWLTLRKEVLAVRWACEECGTDSRLNLHHLYYYKHGKSVLYRERQYTDVFEVLCYPCHMKKHNACSPAVLEVRG
jgi:hypothetical protein